MCRGLLPREEFEQLLEELKQPLMSAVRANRLRENPQDLIDTLSKSYGWQVKGVPYCPSGWFVEAGDSSISHAIEHRLGFYYIQDAASMLPVELFDIDPAGEPLILDMAASPGGKTTHLVDRTMDRGLVIANDSSSDRITALRLVLQGWGAANIAVTHFPGEYFGSWFPELFDRILLDAPCSMQNLRSTESHPMRTITAGERSRLAKRQASLLDSAIRAVKVGGQVVYSTCTLSPEENEGVLDEIIRRFGNSISIFNPSQLMPVPAPGLISNGDKFFHPDVQRAVRLFPHRYHTSGFFAALIKKQNQVASEILPAPQRPFSRTRLDDVYTKELKSIVAFFEDSYGFNLSSILNDRHLSLFRRDEALFLIPDKWLDRFIEVPFQGLGFLFGEEFGGQITPSHEFVERFGMEFQKGVGVLDAEKLDAWGRGEDIHSNIPGFYKKGDVIAIKDQHNYILGRGKAMDGRIKNLLPRRIVR
jgi:16S rRNA (cytosine1407-C5)-methyltransferase